MPPASVDRVHEGGTGQRVRSIAESFDAVLDGDGTDFNDITDVAQLITISRGRHKPLDVFGPGTMSVSISVPVGNRNYDPLNTSSVYYNQLTEQPGLAPLRPIRLSRNG